METRRLGTARAIHVRCHPVDAFGGSNASAIAYTLGSTVHMKIVDCLAARSYGTKMLTYMHSDRASQQVVQRITRNEVFAYSTLLHEALHVQGLHNERMTECAANDAVRWGAQWMGMHPRQANWLSRVAFDMSTRNTAISYHSVSGPCEAYLRNVGGWTALVGV